MDVTPPQNQNTNPQPPQPAAGPDPNAQWGQPQQPAQPQPQQPQSTENWGQPATAQPAAPVYPSPAANTQAVYGAQPQAAVSEENPNKSFVVAYILSIFLGSFGIDRFYLGHIGLGVAKLLLTFFTGIGGAVFTVVDWFLLAHGKLVAADDPRMLDGYAKNNHWAKIVAILLVVLSVVATIGFFVLFAALLAASPSSSSSY